MGVQLTKDMIEGAQACEQQYGIPASVTLGQIMLESGGSNAGGLSGLAYKYNNLFGVTKGSSWKGETVVMSNKNGGDTQTYRVYENVYDSIKDHGKVLMQSNYTQYTSQAKTAYEYAEGIAKGGYATDKDYATKLKNVIKSNNLTAYDSDNWQGKSGTISMTEVSNTMSQMSPTRFSSNNVKWYGDLIIVIMCVGVAIIGVIFFVQAFNKIPKPKAIEKGEELAGKAAALIVTKGAV